MPSGSAKAELAAGVPLVPHPEEKQHLASRLQAVLRAGAERSIARRRASTYWTPGRAI